MNALSCKNKSIALFFATLLFIWITPTHAGQAAGCTVTSNTLSFGNYNVFNNSPLDSTGTIEVRCSPGNTNYIISLDNGLYGTISNRKMRNSSSNETLSYNLYISATYTTLWGDGVGGGVTVSGSKPDNFTVYGRIPPLQDVGIGSYADSITVTVNF